MRKHLLSRHGVALAQLAGLAALATVLLGVSYSRFDHARRGAKLAETYRSLDRLTAAMEAYAIDNGGYPASEAMSPLPGHLTVAQVDNRLLTTPIVYLERVMDDPFRITSVKRFWIYSLGLNNYGLSYGAYPHTLWMTWSNGPDRITQTGSYRSLAQIISNESKQWPQIGGQTPPWLGGGGTIYDGMRYDPTNGLTSVGDIYRHIEQPAKN